MAGWRVSRLTAEMRERVACVLARVRASEAANNNGTHFARLVLHAPGDLAFLLSALAQLDIAADAHADAVSSARLAGIAEERERVAVDLRSAADAAEAISVFAWPMAKALRSAADRYERGEHVSRPGVGGREG